jgi:hypothetical protein
LKHPNSIKAHYHPRFIRDKDRRGKDRGASARAAIAEVQAKPEGGRQDGGSRSRSIGPIVQVAREGESTVGPAIAQAARDSKSRGVGPVAQAAGDGEGEGGRDGHFEAGEYAG